jgi:hypothetical protein
MRAGKTVVGTSNTESCNGQWIKRIWVTAQAQIAAPKTRVKNPIFFNTATTQTSNKHLLF